MSLPFHLFDSVDSQILNSIATNVWLNLLFFLIFIFFAFSFFGYYELTLPSSWANKMDAASSKVGGVLGIFFMAVTLAIVSFSCTGPILGGLLGGTTLAEGEVAPDLGGAAPPVVSNTPPTSPQVMNRPLPIEQAQAFKPNITPLASAGQGWAGQPISVENVVTPKQESAELLSTWAAATGDPILSEAAAQLADG